MLGSCDTQSSSVHYNTFTQTHQKHILLQLRGILPARREPLGGVQLVRLSLDGLFRYPCGMHGQVRAMGRLCQPSRLSGLLPSFSDLCDVLEQLSSIAEAQFP